MTLKEVSHCVFEERIKILSHIRHGEQNNGNVRGGCSSFSLQKKICLGAVTCS